MGSKTFPKTIINGGPLFRHIVRGFAPKSLTIFRASRKYDVVKKKFGGLYIFASLLFYFLKDCFVETYLVSVEGKKLREIIAALLS